MIIKKNFSKKKNMDAVLASHNDIYAIDSLYGPFSYGFDRKQFGILDCYGGYFCKLEEVPELVEWIKPRVIREEIMMIYNDIMNRKKGNGGIQCITKRNS